MRLAASFAMTLLPGLGMHVVADDTLVTNRNMHADSFLTAPISDGHNVSLPYYPKGHPGTNGNLGPYGEPRRTPT